MRKRIRVAWVCSVSNPILRSHLEMGLPIWYKLFMVLSGNNKRRDVVDYAQWNSNAIEEFEQIPEVDLHVVFVHKQMKKRVQCFIEKGIHYYAVKEDEYGLIGFFRTLVFGNQWLYDRSNRIISKLIGDIHPDIVHMQGAEMLSHSMSILMIPRDIPCIVQLETLLHTPESLLYLPNPNKQRDCEFKVLQRADYIGHKAAQFAKIVRETIKKDAIIINTRLIIGEKVNLSPCEKEYDFTFFANYINKSVDLAIEAFAIAHRQCPDLTLDIIGSVKDEEQAELRKQLDDLGCGDAVTFEGSLPTHDDVIAQVRKARFALLPLKVDYVSSTIREAMWNGVPVVTTKTAGTPLLNEKRESVLISEIGNPESMAANMLKLAKDKRLAEMLRNNAVTTVEELYGNNALRAKEWVDAYHACIKNFKLGIPLPESVINAN